jgi:hypothetical protein
MKKVEDYRQHATECRMMASRSRSPEEKTMLMNMAATWESLAADRGAKIERQERDPVAASITIDRLNASNDE